MCIICIVRNLHVSSANSNLSVDKSKDKRIDDLESGSFSKSTGSEKFVSTGREIHLRNVTSGRTIQRVKKAERESLRFRGARACC